ncbi:hypothetical protein V6N12_010037 [Hibiscus sabdariffa]|uniref:Uncharacterized protein n=1 Tax=Hibiscus sabdariffa TaxID=183260 RepID=A0ABR2ECH9_9ROSI
MYILPQFYPGCFPLDDEAYPPSSHWPTSTPVILRSKRGRPAPGEHSIGRKGSPDGSGITGAESKRTGNSDTPPLMKHFVDETLH